eukprot:g895.t1
MSGRRPSKTRTWTFATDFRRSGQDAFEGPGANWTSFPQWFKEHGFFTHGMGKVFHPGNPANFDPPSWSDPARVSDGAGKLPLLPGMGGGAYVAHEQAARATALALARGEGEGEGESEASAGASASAAACLSGEQGGSYCELPSGTAGPDDTLAANAAQSVAMLANYSAASSSPFFLAVGFHKPHIPWTIPTRFFQPLPSMADTALPAREQPPHDMPPIAWNKGLGTHALDSYADTNRHPLHAFANGSYVTFPHNLTRAMRRAYYAAVSYTDRNIGLVLDALAASPAAADTVTVFMGDHGYSLGELNEWCKMNVFEAGTRVPLIVRVPPGSGAGASSGLGTEPGLRKSATLAEAIDLFPTLVEVAARSTPPPYADGTSLAGALGIGAGASASTGVAYSEFVKCYSCCRVPDQAACLPGGTQGRCAPADAAAAMDLSEMGNCFQVPSAQIDFIGYSVRNARWRYTEWLRFDNRTMRGDFGRRVASELYDHVGDNGGAHDWDRFENANVAGNAVNNATVAQMHALLLKGFGPLSHER